MSRAPSAPAPGDPEPSMSRPRRRSAARAVLAAVLRRLALAGIAGVALVVLLLVAARLYFSDERLRQIALEEANARVPAKVTLAALELSLISGLELRGLRVGPPDGFTRTCSPSTAWPCTGRCGTCSGCR